MIQATHAFGIFGEHLQTKKASEFCEWTLRTKRTYLASHISILIGAAAAALTEKREKDSSQPNKQQPEETKFFFINLLSSTNNYKS